MDGSRDYHTKQSKSERERQILYAITCMWNLNYDTNELFIKQKQKETHRLMDIENRLVVAKQWSGGKGRDWEFVISRCKLLHVEWINNKALLYLMGNCTHYPIINQNGKEYEKEYTSIFITESLCCTAEIKITL